ncbi:MAG TPA: secretin N-terminal domain-containing protein [Verrucomicrobiales bacterium]|nr:secretin N-terminal domain-containing protein [Verrucomicrobiales bacterium]
MSRPPILLLSLLLSFPLAAPGQDSKAKLSPALRAKLLAQAPQPANPPATAGNPSPSTPAPRSTAVPPPRTAVPLPSGAKPASTTGANPASATGATNPAPTTGANQPSTSGQNQPGTRTPRPGTGRNAGGNNAAQPGRTNPSTTIPPIPGRTDTAAPTAAEAPGMAPRADNPYGDIAFLNADINDVIQKYEEITHRHVIRDKDLAGNVTVYANPDPIKPFSPEEAAEFIKAALSIQGFLIQRYNDTTDKAVPLSTGKPPGIEGNIEGFPLYIRPAGVKSADINLPVEDQIINFILTFDHIPVVEATPIIAQAVPVRQWSKYVAVPSANSLFIQEYVSTIRTLLKVVDKIDLPPVELVHEWVELERASAEDVQAILDQILQAQTKSTAGAGTGFRSVTPGAAAANLAQPGAAVPGGAAGASAGLMADGSSVIVRADPRTNRVFINGPKKHVDYLKNLIHEFDEPSRVKNLLTQQLRYIPVNEFFGLAVTSLEATGAGQAGTGSTGGPGGAAAGGGRNTGGRNFGGNDFGGGGGGGRNNFSTQQTSTRNTGGAGGGSRSTRNGTSAGLSGGTAGSTSEPPQAQTVGKTLLISDPRTNSLIVSGPPDSIQRVSELVKEMDRRPYQVHINAVIAQMAIGNDMQTAVDYLRRVDTFTVGGETISAAGLFRSGANANFIDPTTLINNTAFPTATTGVQLFAAVGELFNAYVKALENNTRSRLLAKPHITIANNETGTISSGSRIPIPANQQSTVVAGGTTSLNSSVEYENVVLELNVTPLINSKNEITLTVDQLNDSLSGTTNISGNEIPNIDTQTLSTRITIPNGAILVLGGLISEQEIRGSSGFPILSKIPVVKLLFGSTSKIKQRRELVILLQARIIESADDMVDINNSEIQRTVVGPDAELFTKPDRNTDNVKLPTFESDIPFNNAGATIETTTETIVPATPPPSTGKKTIRVRR